MMEIIVFLANVHQYNITFSVVYRGGKGFYRDPLLDSIETLLS